MLAEDWETGEKTQIPLDPLKTAMENAQVLYNKAKKQKRGRLGVEPLLVWSRGELEYIQEVEESLDQLDSLGSDEDLQVLKEIQVCKFHCSSTIGALALWLHDREKT